MSAPGRPLAEVLDALARNRADEAAWTDLASLSMPAIAASLYRALPRFRSDIDDLAQDVLVRIARYFPFGEIRESDVFWAYVHRIIRHAVADFLHLLKTHPRPRGLSDVGDRPPPARTAAEATLEDERQVLGAKLSEDERKLLDGLAAERPLKEIASELGISLNALSVRLHRLRARLSGLLRT